MRNRLFLLSFFSIYLLGCGKLEVANNKENQAKRDDARLTINDEIDSVGHFGEFSKNSTIMQVRDTYAIWDEPNLKLKIYLTPTKITDAEKSRLDSGDTDFFVFYEKESPDENRWQWYPFILMELRFSSSEISSENIRDYYIAAYGIEEENYTDNINSFPSETEKFQSIYFRDNVLSAVFYGERSEYSWNVKVKQRY